MLNLFTSVILQGTCIMRYIEKKNYINHHLSRYPSTWVPSTLKELSFSHKLYIFFIPIALQPDVANLWFFKLRLFDLEEFTIWNIQGLRHWVTKIWRLENQNLWQKLNSFNKSFLFGVITLVKIYIKKWKIFLKNILKNCEKQVSNTGFH